MEKLNPKEKRIFDYISISIREKGYAPSVRDICSALDYKSTSTVHMYIERLEKLGYINKDDGKSRAITVGDGEQTAFHFIKVPIIGHVTAGQPILAAENFDGYTGFMSDGNAVNTDNYFALRVKGTSMIGAGILDGDVIIAEKTDCADNGKIVVAMVNDETTVKRFYYENGGCRLQSENSEMQSIIVGSDESISILGRVVAVNRVYR